MYKFNNKGIVALVSLEHSSLRSSCPNTRAPIPSLLNLYNNILFLCMYHENIHHSSELWTVILLTEKSEWYFNKIIPKTSFF
jgi:hypothetical protein